MHVVNCVTVFFPSRSTSLHCLQIPSVWSCCERSQEPGSMMRGRRRVGPSSKRQVMTMSPCTCVLWIQVNVASVYDPTSVYDPASVIDMNELSTSGYERRSLSQAGQKLFFNYIVHQKWESNSSLHKIFMYYLVCIAWWLKRRHNRHEHQYWLGPNTCMPHVHVWAMHHASSQAAVVSRWPDLACV